MRSRIRYNPESIRRVVAWMVSRTLLTATRTLKLRELKLELHPDKVYIKTFVSGVDFLGWVHFADHRVLRTASKRRMLRRLKERQGQEGEEATRQSYRGMLRHGNARKLEAQIGLE